jgi:hypothetical protein
LLVRGAILAFPVNARGGLPFVSGIRPPEDAPTVACRAPIGATSAGCGQLDGYMPFSQAGRIRFGNMVDPRTEYGCVDHKKISGFMMHRPQRGGVRQ